MGKYLSLIEAHRIDAESRSAHREPASRPSATFTSTLPTAATPEHDREYRRARELAVWAEQHHIDITVAAQILELETESPKTAAEVKRVSELDAACNERDGTTSRGYDNSCICKGRCRWCRTLGVISCGACERGKPEYVEENVKQGTERDEIDPAVRVEIARIEDDALKFGWSPQRLWRFQLWPIRERGLAALLDAGDRLTLHPDHIEITKADGNTQRYWLHEA